MRSSNLFKVLFACLLMSGLMRAQGVGASGDITGSVTDPSGSLVGGAAVTVTDVERGTNLVVNSDANGVYRATVQPATYSVSVAKAGFQTEIVKNIVVNVGQTTLVDFPMKVSQVAEQVEVTTEPPVIETERGAQANVVNETLIRDLPINRRDYLSFTLLAPAVNDATRLAGDQDFRVKQTPQSGLSFYGSNGRGNNVTVDGGEANDDSGGVRLNLGQDAVQEFQINRSNYAAEFGGANGATINIVSKSGTNQAHGSLFGFFRNDALDASSPFSFAQALAPGQVFNPAAPDSTGTPVKDTLTREQFGATIGFPLKKDKTFLFSSFEGLMADAQNAVPLLTSTSIFRPNGGQQAIINGLAALGATAVPCLTGQPALPAATCAGILSNVLTTTNGPAASPLSKFIVGQFENNGGVFPYNTRQYLTSTRLDHQFSDHNQVYLRYNFSHDREENPDLQSLIGFSRGSSIHSFDHTILGEWFHQFSGRTLNEARVQYSYLDFSVVPNQFGAVGLDIPGFGNFGNQIFLPSFNVLRRWEFADNVSVTRGKHALKIGAYELLRGDHAESHTFFPGRFVFGNLPGGILSPCLQVPAACGLTAASSVINPIQSAKLGLPQFYQQGFGNPTYNYPRPLTSLFAQDSWKVTSNFTFNYGARYELDSQYGPLHTDKNNVAPRVSFAWDPFKDHKTVVRAGYGIFYAQTYGQIPDVVQTLGLVNGQRQIAQVFVPLTGVPGSPPALTSAAIFQTLFAQGIIGCTSPLPGNAACITPANLTQFGINVTNSGPVPPLSVLFSGQRDYQNPYSQQAEFGIEREIGRGLSVSASGIYVHTNALPIAIDRNALPTAPFTTVTGPNGNSVTFHNWAAPQCAGAGVFTCFANPLLLQDNVYSSKGSALYEGVIFEVNKRMSNHFTLMTNYTFSKAFDTTTDFNSDFGPVDNTNLSGERGLSSFDQRHKVVVASVIDTGRWGGPVASNFQFAPVVRYNSGHPFNLLAGADVNGDRHSTNDRPLGASRNTGQGPDFMTFDMRVMRGFKLGERGNLQFIAEGFNLANRTNYASVNNVVGPNFGLTPGFTTFNVKGSAAISPSSPLGFTSAFPKRQLQFGARFQF